MLLYPIRVEYWNKIWSYLSSLEGIKELTFKFSGSAAGLFGDSFPFLGMDSIEGHNRVSGKGFPTTGPQIEAGNVVIHRGLHVMRPLVVACVLSGVRSCLRIDPDAGCSVRGSHWSGHCSWSLVGEGREMPPRRGARRGGRGGRGRGTGRVQPEVQPVAQATDPAAPVTHADLAAMEQRFRDLIMQMREQQQPAPPAPAPAPAPIPAPAPAPVPVAPQVVPDQLSVEAKHLRDFRKYNPTIFDESLEDPTRAQLWLSSLETIFRYMKCPEDQKVQFAVFMLTDRGTAWWETTERMLGGDEFLNLEQGDMTVEQYDAEFDMLSRFAPEMIATEAARADKFVRGLRLDIQGLVRAFRPATHADALRLAVDLSLQERANSSKAAGRGSTSGQKRKAEQQPVPVPQRNFRSGGEFRRFQQKPFEVGEAARGKPLCTTCGKHHLGRCLFGTRTCFKCRQEGHTADRCP
ncbi:gag protease polyprotein [Cucumis melo var. makuwa]|uniref:Gag protease polyprotein n=1 Tax=Cucumis melo var. makuwa TaxID=1194695 RepID=A0A5A7TJZ4_CUCMM|nr:gag protease polyprotein [Cucumis melo var. makuwa]